MGEGLFFSTDDSRLSLSKTKLDKVKAFNFCNPRKCFYMLFGHLRKFNIEQFQQVRIYLLTIHQSLNKTHLITRRVVSPVMMLIRTCAVGGGGCPGACSPGKNDIDNAIWCILNVPKYVIISLNIINPNFVPYFSPRSIQMRTLVQK